MYASQTDQISLCILRSDFTLLFVLKACSTLREFSPPLRIGVRLRGRGRRRCVKSCRYRCIPQPASSQPCVCRVVPVPLYSPASHLTAVCVGPCRYRCIPQPSPSQPYVCSRASTTSSPRSPSAALRTSGEADGELPKVEPVRV
jgi:hypothetical protein